MSTSTSASTAGQVDIGEAFGYVFRSRNWFGKIAVGALCVLFFWVIFIPLLILLGYCVETARTIKNGARELPPWQDIGKKLGEGFILAVVLIIWDLPGIALSSTGFPHQVCTGNPPTCTLVSGSGVSGLGSLYNLLLAFLTPAIWSQYIEGGFTNAFQFGAIFRRALQNPGMTVLVWLMGIVAIIIGFAGVIIVFIGILFTLPYGYLVIAHLYGQFGRATEGLARAT